MCHLVGRPSSWWTWDLRIPTLFSVKNRFSDPTKEQEGRDQPRKDVMNRCQVKALREGCHKRKEARMGVSSREKMNTNKNLVRATTKSKSEMLYCATIVLGGYSSHSGKIHYIQDADLSLYVQHHLRRTLAFYALGLVTPSIHLLPAEFASIQAEPLTGHILSSSTSAFIYQACALKGVARPCGSFHF